MNVDNSIFNDIKVSFANLQRILSVSYENVSVLVQNSYGKNYRYSPKTTSVTDNAFSALGAVIKLYVNGIPYEYSFNDFSEEYLSKIPEIIKNNLMDEGLPINSVPGQNSTCEVLNFNKSTSFKIDPSKQDDKELLSSMKDICDRALAYDERIFNCITIYQYLFTHKLFISDVKNIEQHLLWSNFICQPMAKKGNVIRDYRISKSGVCGAELMTNLDSELKHALDTAIALLDSSTITPGKYDVICMPDVTGIIAHEAFGHGVEMDMFVKDRALAKNNIGSPIASPLVNMHDNSGFNQCGMYFFDDEGELSHDTLIIKNGTLLTGMNDTETAKALSCPTTGNGRRESYERKAYTRMSNTYFEPGTDKLQDMIASVEDGILLENASSGMEDPKNWGIQCMVNVGREIKNGKLTGKIYSPVCISGYVPDLLKSISMMSETAELSGTGYCGKGYKEWVKVSEGGPAIKAKAVLS